MTDLAQFNPFDPATQQCPFPHYRQMRDEAPVLHLEGMDIWWVTKHDVVLAMLRDSHTYSSKFGNTSMPLPPEEREQMVEVMKAGIAQKLAAAGREKMLKEYTWKKVADDLESIYAAASDAICERRGR